MCSENFSEVSFLNFSGDEFELSHKVIVTDTTKLKLPNVEGNMQNKISVV